MSGMLLVARGGQPVLSGLPRYIRPGAQRGPVLQRVAKQAHSYLPIRTHVSLERPLRGEDRAAAHGRLKAES